MDNSPFDQKLSIALNDFTGVELIAASENLGFGQGNNLGIKKAIEQKFKYIFLLNNDAVVRTKTISVLYDFMESNPDIDILSPKIVLDEDPDVLWYGGGEVDWWTGGGKIPGFLGKENSVIANQAREVTFISGCAMFVRADVFKKIGGFDKRFFMYEEDLELCLRAREHGMKLFYNPNAIVAHKGQGSLRNEHDKEFVTALDRRNANLPFYAFHFTRNRLLNMYLHASTKNFIRFIIGFIPRFVFRSIEYLVYGRIDGFKRMLNGIFSFFQVILTTTANPHEL